MAALELHKLNGDTSWLFRLPRPQDIDEAISAPSFYNLVVDPWLDSTPQIDGSPLFSRQTRVEPAAFDSISQLDQWLQSQPDAGRIDAVLFSHPFTDHLHPETIRNEETLAALQRATIFTTRDSLAALRLLKIPLDSSKVIDLTSLAVRQDAEHHSYLPPGISIDHLPARDWAVSPAWSKLHAGILISCFNSIKPAQILYSPHGMTPKSLPSEFASSPSKGVSRILIHSFDRQTLPLIGTVACGFPNVLDLIPAFKPHMVLATHDEDKQGEGIVGRLLSREVFPFEQAQQLVKELRPRAKCVLKQLSPGESIQIT